MKPTNLFIPTQHDVARVAGVSQAAVSRVLSGGPVSAAATKKVMAACKKLSYVPDIGARALVTGSSNMIAVIVANIMNPFYPFFLERLTSRIQQEGREVLLLSASLERNIDDLLPVVLQYKVRGTIIMTANLSSKMAGKLREHRVQAVMVNRYSKLDATNSVACDNVSAGKVVAEAFINAGYTKLGYIGGAPSSSTNLDRKTGFLNELDASGIHPLFALDGEFNHEWGYTAGMMLRRISEVEAVFCCDDVIAMGLIDNLREVGRNVPEDMAIVGFDDVPSAAWPSYSLTTVQQPIDEMISKALAILDLAPTDEPQHARIPGKMIYRRSFPETSKKKTSARLA
jgi:DNA-binding LacI/PurR family transcriptional regulator